MALDKNSELYKVIRKAVLQVMKTIDQPIQAGTFRMPKNSLKLMKKLVKKGKSDFQIQKTFLNKLAFSGCTDRNYVIRWVNAGLELLRKTG